MARLEEGVLTWRKGVGELQDTSCADESSEIFSNVLLAKSQHLTCVRRRIELTSDLWDGGRDNKGKGPVDWDCERPAR